MPIKLKNNVVGYLATAISASDTGLVLQSGNGASFPTLGTADYFYATLVSTGGTQEVVKVTARVGDTMTVVRAQEGSSAAGFAVGTRVEMRVTAQSVLDVGRDYVSVKDFGAVSDGAKDPATGIITGTNNFAAFQNALDYLQSIGGGTLVVPSGKYAFYNTGVAATTQLFIKSNIIIMGRGKESSQLLYNDSTGIFAPLLNVGSPYNFDIHLTELGFISDWGANNDWTQRSHYMQLGTSGRVTITNCLFAHIRYICCSIGFSQSVTEVKVSNCTFFRSVSDGCSIRNADSAIITNNYFKDINDDCIAVHTRDIEPEPVQNTAIIANNHIVDSQGIRVQGIKKATITGNVITRAHYAGISVTQYGGVEGYTQNFALNIANNVIDTVFDGSLFAPGATGAGVRYIALEMPIPTTDGTGYVGYSNGSGGIVQPFNYFYKNDTDASPAKPETGAWFISISNNTLTRTYTTVANYSDYGLGQRFARLGPVDIAITDNVLGIATSSTNRGQIHITNSGRFMVISGNTLFGYCNGIVLEGTPGSAYFSWDDVRIANNQISQYLRDGVRVSGTGNVVVAGNIVNGDPLNTHPYRGASGTWTFPTGFEFFHTAIRVNGGFAEVTGNSFRNVQAPIAIISLDTVSFLANTYYCKPNSTGQDTANIGIGNLTSIYARGANNVVIIDDDPGSATFNTVLNMCPSVAGSIPTSGIYLQGHLVTNLNRSELGSSPNKYIVLAWTRKTTGSAHVLNTDWNELRCLTGN